MVKKKKIEKRKWFLFIIGFFIFVLFDIGMFYVNYQDYQDKVVILSTLVKEQEKDNLIIATELLKGEETITSKEGKKILKEYGYLENGMNRYYKEWKNQCIIIIACSIIIYLCFLCCIYFFYKYWEQKRKQEFQELEEILLKFRKGNYDFCNSEDTLKQDNIQNRIYSQLESLGSYLNFMDKRAIQEKEQTKSLVTNISHQLKTPVAALRTCFEILQNNDLSPEEQNEFFIRFQEQLKRLEELITALIHISRMETGMIQIKKEKKCLFDTLVLAINRIYLKAEEKQIELVMEAEEELKKLKIPHDVKWLSEAFINILDNAIKYSLNETTITIRIIKRISFLRIEIEDQGIGIPKEEYHKIFKRFYRGESKKVMKESGSGIGLYLTQEIINKHYGMITVKSSKLYYKKKESSTNNGSMFVIQLPYKE